MPLLFLADITGFWPPLNKPILDQIDNQDPPQIPADPDYKGKKGGIGIQDSVLLITANATMVLAHRLIYS